MNPAVDPEFAEGASDPAGLSRKEFLRLMGASLALAGACTRPLPAIEADIVTLEGKPVDINHGGFLVIRKPWPSMMRTIYKDPERYRTYWTTIEGNYFAGDAAHKDADGYFWVQGRVDDVIKVSGHRLGSMEVESSLVSHPAVAEAAAVIVAEDESSK